MLKRVACFSASLMKKKRTVACFLDNLALECGQPHSSQRATHVGV